MVGRDQIYVFFDFKFLNVKGTPVLDPCSSIIIKFHSHHLDWVIINQLHDNLDMFVIVLFNIIDMLIQYLSSMVIKGGSGFGPISSR